jgi:hypothetical protein
VLRGVAVVDVVVDDRDPADARRARVSGADGDVVEEAEAHGTGPLGMVSRRTDQRQSPLMLAAQHPLYHLDASAGG